MSENTVAIETRGLRKEYGAKVAVDTLTLTVRRGEIFGFLGPNGAGKTTSVKMLLGLVAPTAGDAWLLGKPIRDVRCREGVGFLPEHFCFHEWLRAEEFLDLHGRLHHVPAQVRQRRISDLLHLVGLTDARDRRLGAFSKGMLQRIGLAQALINEPELVFLDEPTSGLDPLGRRMVRDIIRHLRERGTTVFLNSHLLSEVEVTCTRVAFVAAGCVRLVTDLSAHRDGLLLVDLKVGGARPDLLDGLQRWSSRTDRVDQPSTLGTRGEGIQTLTLQIADERVLPEIARWLLSQQVDLYGLTVRALSLEDLFVQVVGDDASCETC